jgi:hypothetical protein
MGDHELRGDDFVKKADQKLSGWGFFGNKYEDAAELLDKASNFFKLAKNCEAPPLCLVPFAISPPCACSRTSNLQSVVDMEVPDHVVHLGSPVWKRN